MTEALERVSQRLRALMRAWADEIGDGTNLAADLARLAHEYVTDRPRALLEYELYLAAARSPELRPSARVWLHGAREFLAPLAGREAAFAITALLDGYMLAAIATDDPPSTALLQSAIDRQLA